MSDTSQTPTAPAPAQSGQKKSGAMKWIVLGSIIVFLLGGGGAAAWWLTRSPAPAEDEEDAEAEEEGQAAVRPAGDGIVAMEPFLVNLADKNASRYVRVTMRLVVETKKQAEEIAKDEVMKTRLRSAVLEVLTQQTADRLVTPDGKADLKKAIAERTTSILGSTRVLDVLFTDFVVQF